MLTTGGSALDPISFFCNKEFVGPTAQLTHFLTIRFGGWFGSADEESDALSVQEHFEAPSNRHRWTHQAAGRANTLSLGLETNDKRFVFLVTEFFDIISAL